MRNVKSILTAAFALTVICAVVVAALAGTNLLTKGTIKVQQVVATNEACEKVLTGADSFTKMSGEWQDGVLEVYRAKNGDTLVGYVVKTDTNGKGSGLVVMTGVTVEGVVSGVEVIENNETAGYIEKVTKGGLFDRLLGVSAVDEVAAVSQATKTSDGIKAGVALALATVQEVTANG